VKQQVLDLAHQLGFDRAVIASLEPLAQERLRYQQWLDAGHAGGMEYLKRDPEGRTTPRRQFPQSLSAIVVSVNYYTPPPPRPAAHFGQVASYAVGLDYHVVLRARLRELRSRIEQLIGRQLVGKPYTDDVALYEQGLAARHGLGFAGKNTLIIGPKLSGSYNFIAELMTDLPLEPDEPYQGTCGDCFRCGSNCPTGAITGPRHIDARLCISYLTIENKNEIPVELRSRQGSWVFGCDVCQDVCPYNSRRRATSWPELRPEAGAGHYLDLFELLTIEDEQQFRARFLPTPLRRPKRRGLLRNALVVLGNQKPEGGIARILAFALNEPDAMLREHAIWAIAQYDCAEGRRAIDLLNKELDAESHARLLTYL
jgi:epoxyqueuosine reductase